MKMISGVLCVISLPRALPASLAGKMNVLFLKLCPWLGAPAASSLRKAIPAAPAAQAPAVPGHSRSPGAQPCKGLPAGARRGLCNTIETHGHCLGSIFPASLPSSPAGMQPLTGKPNPPTMSLPSARDADFPFWRRKDLQCVGLRC